MLVKLSEQFWLLTAMQDLENNYNISLCSKAENYFDASFPEKKKNHCNRVNKSKNTLHFRNGLGFCSHSYELPYCCLSSIQLSTRNFFKEKVKIILCVLAMRLTAKNIDIANFSLFYTEVFMNLFFKRYYL